MFFSGPGLKERPVNRLARSAKPVANTANAKSPNDADITIFQRMNFRLAVALQAFIDGYIASRTDVKPRTRLVYQHTRGNLIDHFGPDKAIRDITPGDADEWRLHLLRKGLAENTVRRRCGVAKQFLSAAVRKRLIQDSPFAGLKAAMLANVKRLHFVTRAEAESVLDACPDAEWRLIFALSRFGGLRCPSEHLALRWDDIDWEHGRITVRSPKTEHLPGGESRLIPLFPELLPHLQDVFEEAEPGSLYVIGRYRDSGTNLRTHLTRIIRKAGLKPWGKLFQNLRSTRETELSDSYPMHVVCAWIGNSQPVAAKHYLQVTPAHFASALQNPVQQAHERGRTGPQHDRPAPPEHAVCGGMRNETAPCENTELSGIRPVGLEPTTR
ncbi:MAG TPA: integrase [Phycisphaerae bacterium]|nr:integrase [Phycisphaerae bacterium]HDZ44301.1 integrase [Phycisphaerae bacterium]